MEVFMASLADEEDSTRKLTNRQKTFARHIVEGVFSNAECARKAGYVPDTAAIYASRLLNGRDLVKTLSSGVLYLFPADQGPELARGGCSAAQGSRFEDMGSLVEGLRSEVEDHYRKSCGLRRV
jgi:hypothetical protein